jgi:eukaryotic-like serine/threonine-protein kinase
MPRTPLCSTSLAAVTACLLLIASAQERAGEAGKAAPKGGVTGRLAWFDRQGNMAGKAGSPGIYRTLAISPDGKRVAFERADPQTQNRDIWLLDIATGAETRFTSDPGWDAFPIWSPDGRRIIFTSNRSGVYDLYQKAADGRSLEELFYQSSEGKGPTGWSPDGKYLIYYSLGQPTQVRLLPIAGSADRKPTPLVDPPFTSITGRFSPDGRWIVYASNESGKNEISVRSFDTSLGTAGDAVVVTTGGGRTPLWRGDGKEIFYITPGGAVTVVDIKSISPFQTGPPKSLFQAPAGVLFWDVSPDGTRFLMPVPDA